ncbi:MAG: Rieske 2Fe-2S domain-containing protein [Actinomycetota bacterium]|nr:Rieske 2Fe-2S domain-containing protein [Actinomycetota bacterium]
MRSPADRITTTIEHAALLDGVADRVAALTRRVLPQSKGRGLLSGKALGHPAHPGLVAVPMGTLISATALDLVGGPRARPAARRLIGLGLLSAVPTAATGASDWLDTEQAERRVGLIHWGLNVVALALYGASWTARGRDRQRQATTLALAGVGVLGGSGWLGGHLAFALGVGVDTTAFVHMTPDWSDVGPAAELDAPGATLSGHAAGTAVLVVRTPQGLAAMADRCSHRGAPLHEGTIDADCVVCPWHGSVFTLVDGSVARGPATRPQPTFEVRTVKGRIEVRRPDEQSALRTNPV